MSTLWWLNITFPTEYLYWEICTPNNTLAKVTEKHNPTLIYFSACWCLSCRHLESKTFSNAKVQNILKKFNLVRINISNNPEIEIKSLIQKWQIRGVPTIIFLDHTGNIINDLTLIGFENPNEFLIRLPIILKKNNKIFIKK